MATNWVIWDGDCGLCAWSIDRLMNLDKRGALTPVTAENCPTPPMTAELQEAAKHGVIFVPASGSVAIGADAVFAALRLTRGRWLSFLGWPPFIWLGRPVYGLIARNRGRISARFFGGKPCGIAHRSVAAEQKSSEN